MGTCRFNHGQSPQSGGGPKKSAAAAEALGRSRGLREEFIQLLLLAQRQGAVTNKAVQQLMGVSKATATRYLTELEQQGYLLKTGTTGVGTSYSLKDS